MRLPNAAWVQPGLAIVFPGDHAKNSTIYEAPEYEGIILELLFKDKVKELGRIPALQLP